MKGLVALAVLFVGASYVLGGAETGNVLAVFVAVLLLGVWYLGRQ